MTRGKCHFAPRVHSYLIGVGLLAVLGSLVALVTVGAPTETSTLAVLGVTTFIAFMVRELATHGPAGGIVSSVIYLPLLGTLVLIGPVPAVLATILTNIYGGYRSQKGFVKVAFNSAQMVNAILVAALAYHLLGGAWLKVTGVDNMIFPYIGASVAYFLVNRTLVVGVVSLTEAHPFWETWRLLDDYALPIDITLSLIALPAAHLYWETGLAGLILGFSPTVLLAAWPYSPMSADSHAKFTTADDHTT